MNKKRILIVCRSFYPKNSPRSHRATELAKEFARQGHIVTVLTPKDNNEHDSFEKKYNVTIKDLGKPRWKNPNFGNLKIGYFFTRVIARLLLLLFEYPSIELMYKVKKSLNYEENYDLLISIATPYPIHWGVAKIWDKKPNIAKTWIADCGDPYMGNKIDSFNKMFYFKYVEKWFMRKTDYITIPVENARSAYYKEFHHKIKVIPQGFKFLPNKKIEINSLNEIPTFAYAGGFIPNKRDPRPFLDYLSSISIKFRFIIFTNNPELIYKYKNKLGEKLQIRSYVPREELLSILSCMDFLVNFDNNTKTVLPSKLIDYAITGRPILNITKSLDTSIINQFLEGDYKNALKINNIEQYRIENICAQFLSLI